jgi:hypothetical protein
MGGGSTSGMRQAHNRALVHQQLFALGITISETTATEEVSTPQ